MFLSQRKYAAEILERSHMVHCYPSRTLVDTESKLRADGYPDSDLTLYRSVAELHTPQPSATLVYCDNANAVYLSSNLVRVLRVPSRYQYVNICTKASLKSEANNLPPRWRHT
nr:ribonuclease H-like domain-containing protein [Tanacetum cinerariifolium]